MFTPCLMEKWYGYKLNNNYTFKNPFVLLCFKAGNVYLVLKTDLFKE